MTPHTLRRAVGRRPRRAVLSALAVLALAPAGAWAAAGTDAAPAWMQRLMGQAPPTAQQMMRAPGMQQMMRTPAAQHMMRAPGARRAMQQMMGAMMQGASGMHSGGA